MGSGASQSFEGSEGNLNKLIGSWPSIPKPNLTFAVTQDTTLGPLCRAGGSARHEVPDVGRVFALVCLLAFLSASLCPSSCLTPTGVVPLRAGEVGEVAKGATPRVRKQLASKAFYLRPEPFCLSDKKQYTKQWFPTSSPSFPYRRAERGRGSCEERSLPGPPYPGNVESMLCAPRHVCAWLCTCLCNVCALWRVES